MYTSLLLRELSSYQSLNSLSKKFSFVPRISLNIKEEAKQEIYIDNHNRSKYEQRRGVKTYSEWTSQGME